MVLDADEDVQVAGRTATHAGLALAGDAQLLPIVDARRDGELEIVFLPLAALAAAARAETIDRLPRAAAARARRHVHEAAEYRLLHLPHFAAAAAGRAIRD